MAVAVTVSVVEMVMVAMLVLWAVTSLVIVMVYSNGFPTIIQIIIVVKVVISIAITTAIY